MKRLRRWIRRQAAREARHPRLDDALITARGGFYARYRLQFLSIRVLLKASLAITELILLAHIFAPEFLAPVFIMRTAMTIGTGMWWGGLEQMRETIRHLAQRRQWHSVRREIDFWLSRSVMIGMFLSVAGTLLVSIQAGQQYYGFSIFNAYVLAGFLRLSLELLARTWHSGIFSLRRIYRPLWSLLLTDVLDVAMVLILWPFLGAWGFSVSLLSVGILRAAFLFWFSTRAYGDSEIPPLRIRHLHRTLIWGQTGSIYGFLRYGLANLASQVDNVLMVSLLATFQSGSETFRLVLVFYALRPFISAGYSWPRLFYFDFKLIEHRYGDFVLQRFNRFMVRTGIVFSLIMGTVALGWVYYFRWPLGLVELNRDTITLLCGGFLLFFMARSLFGMRQMQAFSLSRFRYLFQTGGIALLSAVVLPRYVSDPVILLFLLSCVLLVTVVRSPIHSRDSSKSNPPVGLVSLPAFISLLRRFSPGDTVSCLLLDRQVAGVHQVCRSLATRMPRTLLTRVNRTTLLCVEPQKEAASDADVVSAGGGAVMGMKRTTAADPGATVMNYLNPIVGITGVPSVPASATDLIRSFRQAFSDGVTVTVGRGTLPGVGNPRFLPELRRLLRTISRPDFFYRPGFYRVADLRVAVYCPEGQPQLLFILKKSQDTDAARNFAMTVFLASIHHSTKAQQRIGSDSFLTA